jgi:hypothetical protein
MRICTINGGSLKVFLRRDMHDVISRNGEGQDQERWAQPRRNASQPASPKPDMDNSIVSRFRSHAAATGKSQGVLQ